MCRAIRRFCFALNIYILSLCCIPWPSSCPYSQVGLFQDCRKSRLQAGDCQRYFANLKWISLGNMMKSRKLTNSSRRFSKRDWRCRWDTYPPFKDPLDQMTETTWIYSLIKYKHTGSYWILSPALSPNQIISRNSHLIQWSFLLLWSDDLGLPWSLQLNYCHTPHYCHWLH